MLDFNRYKVLTFDCYGTLIDWESGMLSALQPLLRDHRIELADDAVLELFAEFESALEQGSYRRYRWILETVVERLGERLGFTPTAAEKSALPDSIQNWPPFSDTVEALKSLKQKYQLVILSNIDDELFAGSAKRLEVAFDQVITAEQVGSYKPSHNNFKTMMQRVGLPTEKILHVAQSIYHDIIPARSLGLSTVWVNRRHAKPGVGATLAAAAEPDLTVPDLQTLARLME